MKRSEETTLHKRVPGTDPAGANGRWVILQPSTLTDQPILYFRALPERPVPSRRPCKFPPESEAWLKT